MGRSSEASSRATFSARASAKAVLGITFSSRFPQKSRQSAISYTRGFSGRGCTQPKDAGRMPEQGIKAFDSKSSSSVAIFAWRLSVSLNMVAFLNITLVSMLDNRGL